MDPGPQSCVPSTDPGLDELDRRQSIDFLRAWQGVGLSGEYWEREGVNHFDELDDLAEPDSELTRRVLALADAS